MHLPRRHPSWAAHGTRRGLLAAASLLLCVPLLQAPAGAQAPQEGRFAGVPSTAPPAAPPTPDSLDASGARAPSDAPRYLRRTYPAALKAPLPAKIFKQGGIPAILPRLEIDKDPAGEVGTHIEQGATVTATNAFFRELGINGRSCATCHQPPSGWSISLRNIRARFNNTRGKDPLFAPVDGADCPSTVPAAGTSGSVYGGFKGRGRKALKDAHSLLLAKGLIRIFLPVPEGAEFSLKILSDKPGCNLDKDFGFAATGTYSFYRRPIISTNLSFKIARDDGAGRPSSLMWDGREPNLKSQARSATLSHAQAVEEPADADLDQIVEFETKIFTAQYSDKKARRLNDGAAGGPARLARRRPSPVPDFSPFDEYTAWAALTGGIERDEKRRSIARGQKLFNANALSSRGPLERGAFIAEAVGGLNDVVANPTTASCGTCHNAGHAGSDLVLPPQRAIGTGGHAAAFGGPATAADLPIFEVTCNVGDFPFAHTNKLTTNDPGLAMITGRCGDVGKKTVPQLRGLASHEPFFSDGSAKTIAEVVAFYEKRFTFIDPATKEPKPLTPQERQDLINFLGAL
jgi:cytochrome c peroxidase